MAGERLPVTFYDETEVFLRAYKKRIAQQKKLGNVDVFSTDPIPVSVYKLLLRSAIETNNMFAWIWTTLQWNCMARSASIDCLALHNFRVGIDSIIIKYDDSKADKAGEKLSEKNVYANPLDWIQCPWLALGKSKKRAVTATKAFSSPSFSLSLSPFCQVYIVVFIREIL